MRILNVRTLIASAVLVAVTALPAQAQNLGVGLSFLEGATGVTVDYAKVYKALTNDRTLSWVGDVSFHREGEDGFGADFSATHLLFQGGVRMQGPGGDKLKWHVQGLAGLARTSVSVSATGLTEDICEAFDLDCDAGASDTGFVITPGAGIDYMFSDKRALRVQLDIPIGDGGSGTRFWFGLSMLLN